MMFFLNWFRPKPAFHQGQLVCIDDNDFTQSRYLLVERRRWVKPNHEVKKMWIYDGPIFIAEEGRFSCITYGYCFREELLAPIFRFSGTSVRFFVA